MTTPTIKVTNFIDAERLKADLSFSITDLSGAMIEHASLFAHYGTLAAKASRQVDNLKFTLDTLESKVYRIKREELVASGEKFTEKQLENAVAVDPQIVSIKRCLNEARQIEAVAKTAVEGFRHRRDMLVQLGLISREEMKGEVSINRRSAVDDALKDQKQRIISRIESSSN